MPDIDKIKQQRARDVRIMRDKAAVGIARWALPTIILLFGGLVFSIMTIEDAAMIAIIASATSSTSMALIAILNSMTGTQKEDPMTSMMKENSLVMREMIEYIKRDKAKSQAIRLGDKEVTLTEGSTNIHVSEDSVVYGKDKPLKK